MTKPKGKKDPMQLSTPREKFQNDLDMFMNDVAARLAMLETYYMLLSRDLSVSITAMKTLKNLMQRKKVITDKQFSKEYEKLYKEMLDIVIESEKNAEQASRDGMLSHEEILEMLADPNLAHS